MIERKEVREREGIHSEKKNQNIFFVWFIFKIDSEKTTIFDHFQLPVSDITICGWLLHILIKKKLVFFRIGTKTGTNF